MVKRLKLLADRATLLGASGDEGLELGSSLLATLGVVHVGQPVVGGSDELGGNVLLGLGISQQVADALTHLLVGERHTETKLTEVLEEGVVEGRTLALLVLRVRHRGHTGRVDGRATRGVGQHLAITEELRDELHVGRLTTTGAST